MNLDRDVKADLRRRLPSVERLRRAVAEQHPDLADWAIVMAAQRTLEEARRALRARDAGATASPSGAPSTAPDSTPDSSAVGDEDWTRRVASEARRISELHPRRVVNATGIVLHTNLGRAPLAPGAAAAAAAVAASYSDLELEVGAGRRGDRLGALAAKLCRLSGAEAAAVCNNNAAAVLLVLDTLARGREVVISRGELVEIGGSFRIPEILERAGARLVEVGTTNRTHPGDYERAIGPETALLLKVHRSNFEQRGFVAEVDLAELVAIGRRHQIPVAEDLGSGSLLDLRDRGLPPEAFAPSRLRRGADVVCFSGDKLLGGPQSGIVLGRSAVVDAMRRNPLARALRVDKMTIAALDWTLSRLLDGSAEREIPALRRLLEPLESLEGRARALALRLDGCGLAGLALEVQRGRAPLGGGSLPGLELDTWQVVLRSRLPAQALAAALRSAPVPVIARVREDAVLLDLRTLADDDAKLLEDALRDALR